MRITILFLALGLMLGCADKPDSRLVSANLDRIHAVAIHKQIEQDYYQSYDELLKLGNPKVNEILFKHMASVGKLEDQIKQEAAK